MTKTQLNGLLLALNLVLLALVVYFVMTWPDQPVSLSHSVPPSSPGLTNEAPAAAQQAVPEIVTVTNQLRWAQLESENYRTYIARLRSIGCPEQTIRDIVIADLDKLLAPRLQAIRGRRPDLKYWQPEEEELANNFDHRDWTRQEREIDREKRQVIQELIGVDLVRERLKQKGEADYYERRLSFLPEEKRSQVRQVLDKYDEQEQQIREKEWEESEPLSPSDQAQLRLLHEQRQKEISAVLSPAEGEQLELWMSTTANAVRHSLYGMEATEEEFQAIYKLRKGFDESWGQRDPQLMDDASHASWEQAKGQLEDQFRRQLGDERYAAYKRGEDEDFHHLNATVSRYKLPREKASEIYEYKQMVLAVRERLRSDPALDPQQKETALKEVGVEAERAVRTALGEKAFQYYQRRSQSDWIHN